MFVYFSSHTHLSTAIIIARIASCKVPYRIKILNCLSMAPVERQFKTTGPPSRRDADRGCPVSTEARHSIIFASPCPSRPISTRSFGERGGAVER